MLTIQFSQATTQRLPSLLGVMICATLMSGCLSSPYDGQRVASRARPIDFGGYVVIPSAEVRVLAWNYRAARYDVVGRTRSVARAIHYSGSVWYRWDASVTVGDDYWEPGEHGAAVKFKTEFDDSHGAAPINSLVEDPVYCKPAVRPDDLTNRMVQCSSPISPEFMLCTQNYEPGGSRRGACTRRLVKFSATAGFFDERFFPPQITQSVIPRSNINYVSLRADRASFVDVFQRRLNSDEDAALLGSSGIGYSKFIRLYYPEPNTSVPVSTYDLRRLAEGFGLLDPSFFGSGGWDTGRSVRFYDRGECSLIITWENLNSFVSELLEIEVPRRLAARGSSLDANPASNATLTPILRTGEAGDAFHFVQTYYLSVRKVPSANVRATLRLTAAFSTLAGSLTLNIENLTIEFSDRGAALALYAALGGLTPEQMVSRYQAATVAAVQTQVNAALGSLFPGRMIGRTYGRPEGYEIVLAESQADPNYSLINAACPGICDRHVRTTPTLLGYFDAAFDPPVGRRFWVETDIPTLSLTIVDRARIRVRVTGTDPVCALDRMVPF